MKGFDLNRFLKNIKKKNALLILLVAIGLVYILFDQRGLIQRMRLAGEKGTLEDKIGRLRAQNDSMRVEITKLQTSDKEIERIAREKYFMHRNGEKVIKVEPK